MDSATIRQLPTLNQATNRRPRFGGIGLGQGICRELAGL